MIKTLILMLITKRLIAILLIKPESFRSPIKFQVNIHSDINVKPSHINLIFSPEGGHVGFVSKGIREMYYFIHIHD